LEYFQIEINDSYASTLSIYTQTHNTKARVRHLNTRQHSFEESIQYNSTS